MISLQENEELEHVTKPSRWSYLWGYLLGWITLGVWYMKIYVDRKTTKYYVTDQRVVRADGLLSLDTNEFRVEDIRQVETSASAFGRMVNVGDIELETYSQGEMVLESMPRYRAVCDTIRSELTNSH